MLPSPMQTPPIGGMAPMNTTPPMNTMPPMPPMGKMPGMEMNLDPMARQNFNNMMSGIQSQAMMPPMPMHMNEGGSVNPIMALLQGIGQLFGFGGGQKQGGSGTLDDFNRAFAAARRAGKKTFSFDRNGDGVPELYTTLLEGEEEGANEQDSIAEKLNLLSDQPQSVQDAYRRDVLERAGPEKLLEMSRKSEGYTGPTIPAMEDPYDEVMASAPIMSDEFDVQRRGPEDFAPYPMPEAKGMDPRLNRAMNFDPALSIKRSIDDLENMKYDQVGAYPNSFQQQKMSLDNRDDSVAMPESVDSIEAKLNALVGLPQSIAKDFEYPQNIITDQSLYTDINKRFTPEMMDLAAESDRKSKGMFDNLNLDGVREEDQKGIMKSLMELIGMNQGGSVTDAIAKLEKGGPPEKAKDNETLQYLKDFFSRGISDGDRPEEDSLKIMGGVGLQSLLAMPVIQSLVSPEGRLNKRFFNPKYNFKGQKLRDLAFQKYNKSQGFGNMKTDFTFDPRKATQSYPDFLKNLSPEEKYLDKGKIIKKMLGRGLGQLLKRGTGFLAGFTPSPAGMGSDLPESMIVNKNQGGVVPVQGFSNGGPSKPFFDKDNFFENVLDKFNSSVPLYDSSKYDSASEEAKAENIAAGNAMGLSPGSFIGATEYTYPVGDRLLTFTAGNDHKGFGQDKDPDPIAGTPGGAKPNIGGMTPEEAQAYIKSMAPTTYGTTGDYSDLDTFKNYTFGDPNFQFDDFMQAGQIAGYGQANKLASDINKLSGAAEGTYRQEGEDVVDDSVVEGSGQNVVNDTNTGNTMTSTASTPISPFAKIEEATVVPSTRTVDSTFNPTFTPLASTDIYNPNFLTDLPDFSSLAIDPSQSSAIDLQKFLEMDQDKTTPKAFTPDTTSITDIMKASGYQQGGAVSPGLNMAIDKFISAYS